jgi:hypothetical protein
MRNCYLFRITKEKLLKEIPLSCSNNKCIVDIWAIVIKQKKIENKEFKVARCFYLLKYRFVE